MTHIASLLGQYWPFLAAVGASGIFGGLIAGLLGVGGGIAIVPVLYVVLGTQGIDDDMRMKVAVATSLATIIVTSLSSACGHSRRGAVDRALLRAWALPVIIGVAAGTSLASVMRGWFLTAVFATVAMPE